MCFFYPLRLGYSKESQLTLHTIRSKSSTAFEQRVTWRTGWLAGSGAEGTPRSQMGVCMKGGVHCFAVFLTLFIPLSLCFCFCLDRWSIVVVMHRLRSMSSLSFCASRDVSLHRLSIWNDARRRRRHQTMLDIAVQGVRLLHSWFCVQLVSSPSSLVSLMLQMM